MQCHTNEKAEAVYDSCLFSKLIYLASMFLVHSLSKGMVIYMPETCALKNAA